METERGTVEWQQQAVALALAGLKEGRAGFREGYEAYKRQQANVLLHEWDRLIERYVAALGLDREPAYDEARNDLLAFGRSLPERAAPVALLREHGAEFGMGARETLAHVLNHEKPEDEIFKIMEAAESVHRAKLAEAATKTGAHSGRGG